MGVMALGWTAQTTPFEGREPTEVDVSGLQVSSEPIFVSIVGAMNLVRVVFGYEDSRRKGKLEIGIW